MPALGDAAMEAVVRALYAHPNRRHAVPVDSEEAVGSLRISLEQTVTRRYGTDAMWAAAFGSRWSTTMTAFRIGHGYGEAWSTVSAPCAMALATNRAACGPSLTPIPELPEPRS